MVMIYNWLLHNTGNEGNYLTILNVQRQTDGAAIARLDVMARTKDFGIVNLLIQPARQANASAAESGELAGRAPKETYYFADENQVIAYLADGQTDESAAATDASGIYVAVLEPADDTGGLTFPPEEA